MCGIMGYIGEENAKDIVISGLEDLEYRGYDSAGIAIVNNESINIRKSVGSPSELRKLTGNEFGNIAIGHTRWATHGAATAENAHPHTSESGLFTIVHNGIIENFAELKAVLESDGIIFRSDTDTEVIAHLLEKNYNGDLKGTVSQVLKMLVGSYALAILCRDYSDTVICAKLSSPLFVGTAEEGSFIASDVSAIAEKSHRLYRLNDNEIGLVKKGELKVFDLDGCRIRKNEIKLKAFDKNDGKCGYEHFMLKEIHEQPTAIRNTLKEIITENNQVFFKNFHLSSKAIDELNNIIFVACGSAFHVGFVGSYLCERILHKTSSACVASEFRYKKPHLDGNTLAVIISQSGETADTLAALRIAKMQGAKTVSIVNVENSTIAQESDNVIMTRAGKEIAVATTKAYSAQLAVVYSLIFYLAQKNKSITKSQSEEFIRELKSIPEIEEKILSQSTGFYKYSEQIIQAKYICFIGRSFDYCTAMEASLKLKEISYIPCEVYPAGELKHGTISLVDKNSLIFALCCCEEIKAKTQSNINEVISRGADVICVSHDGEISVPYTDDIFCPMLEIIPLQLIAYYTAKKKNCEIDKPRNLAKSVTVE